jgi:predicted secreted Zn-dependent protease
MVSDTDGFVHIELDGVSVTEYSAVAVQGWVRISNTGWSDASTVKVWAVNGSSGYEKVLVEAIDLDVPSFSTAAARNRSFTAGTWGNRDVAEGRWTEIFEMVSTATPRP